MFRGRCGYDAVGNRQIREKAANHRREVQKTRLDKIKNRKPGTSLNTLDNLPPVVVKAVLTNPRKQLLKAELNLTVDQENKSMLKRISNILTAPPKITDKDYQNLKKLCPPKYANPKEIYERGLLVKHTKQFYSRLKKLKPLYNPHEWEKDYQRQVTKL